MGNDELLTTDQYCLLADFQSYLEAQQQAAQVFQDRDRWLTLSILNAARSGYFSADRAIREYCDDIWQAHPIAITLDDKRQGRISHSFRQKFADVPPAPSRTGQGRQRQE